MEIRCVGAPLDGQVERTKISLQPRVNRESKFPDTPLIIPCSIQTKNCSWQRRLSRMRSLPLVTAGMGRLNLRNSLYFSLLAGNLAGEGLAADCLLRHAVS